MLATSVGIEIGYKTLSGPVVLNIQSRRPRPKSSRGLTPAQNELVDFLKDIRSVRKINLPFSSEAHIAIPGPYIYQANYTTNLFSDAELNRIVGAVIYYADAKPLNGKEITDFIASHNKVYGSLAEEYRITIDEAAINKLQDLIGVPAFAFLVREVLNHKPSVLGDNLEKLRTMHHLFQVSENKNVTTEYCGSGCSC